MSKKDLASIISGAEWVVGFVTDLMAGVRVYGGTEEDVHRLTTPAGRMQLDSICKQIASFGKPVVVETSDSNSISMTLERDLSKERPSFGMKLIYNNTANSNMAFNQLALLSLHKDGEDAITVSELSRRFAWRGYNFGQLHAEWILRNQHLIPDDWKGLNILFCGTVWQDEFGIRYYSCLVWDTSGELYLAFFRHTDSVGRHYRLLTTIE